VHELVTKSECTPIFITYLGLWISRII